MKRAALYLRSSKDRSDVSIDAQRRELEGLARERGLLVVGEFADVVVSGKDENRPAFQSMLRALKAAGREWSAILMLDTSRLARSQYVAHVFRHECRKRGVEVVFAKTPELDGVAGIILPAVLHAMDEVHSFLSREKGLAGMAENVRRGFRAGGRAPWGYRLERVATGAVRDGEPVTKSRLVPDGERFEKIGAYLRGRAQGRAAAVLARDLALPLSPASLVGIERNAIAYAGHTVWNAKRGETPREDWIVQKGTHAAAITEEEAEAILARLGAPKRTRARGDGYLLSGILQTPAGEPWHGNAGYYRQGRKNVAAPHLERAVLARVAADLRSARFAAALVKAARAARPADAGDGGVAELEAGIRREEARVRALADALVETTARRPILERIEEAERAIEGMRAKAVQALAEAAAARQLREVGPEAVRVLLNALADDLAGLDRAHLKDFLRQTLERVELAPDAAECRLHYRLSGSGDYLASPRKREPIPTLRGSTVAALPFRRLRAA